MHHDRMANVVAITNNTGVVTNRYEYSPWGDSPSMSGTTFGFQGQRFDAETGLYYMKARCYDPKTGRFLQPDPIDYGDGLNLYQFAYNNPNSFSDPLGLASEGNENGWGNNGWGNGNGWGNNGWGNGNGWGNNGWGEAYGWGNYHVGYDGGATVDIRLPDGSVVIVDLDQGIISDYTPGHPGEVTLDMTPIVAKAESIPRVPPPPYTQTEEKPLPKPKVEKPNPKTPPPPPYKKPEFSDTPWVDDNPRHIPYREKQYIPPPNKPSSPYLQNDDIYTFPPSYGMA